MSAQTANPRVLARLAIVAVILAAAGIVAFYRFRATATVATVQRGTAADIVTGSVVVHADKDLQQIKSEVDGRVIWIDPRQLGEPFKANEKILKLDSTDLEREIKQAETDFNTQLERRKIEQAKDPTLANAKDRLAEAKLRFDRKEMSENDWKNAQRAFDQVETNLALADFDTKVAKDKFEEAQAERKRALAKMTIRAPMDGVMHGIMVAQGALIGRGTVVADYFSNERVVIAKVGEEDVGRVKVGQPAKVRLLNLGGESLDAKVTAILPFADEDTQRYSVYLQVDAEPAKLKPFSTGEAAITVGEHPNEPLIPRRALFNDEYVFVVTNGVVEKRKVSIGYKALNFAEVTANLKEGEQVIVEDLDQFRDGQHVRTVTIK